MRSDNIEDLMAMDWIPEISQEEDGNVTLHIPGLKGFVVHGSPEDAMANFSQALRSHLSSYLAAGKAVPVPESRIVQGTSRTSGNPWQHLRVNVLMGHMRTRSATAGATKKRSSDVFDDYGGMLRVRKTQNSAINRTVPDP